MMKYAMLAGIALTLSMVSVSESEATQLNCYWEYEYGPGPAELDPDGDGRWIDPDSGIEQRGPIIGVKRTCSGEEPEEVEP
jgi:hypothetical protein